AGRSGRRGDGARRRHAWLRQTQNLEPVAVGHRVVHGGPQYDRPLDGLPMGTRPGQIDPGVVLYLIEEKHMTAAQVQDLLYGDCELKGLSGLGNDVREQEACSDPHARFALDYFVYRVGLQAGLLAAALGGLDAFVFTAGIGENSPSLRARIVETLAWLGGALDPEANAAAATSI